MSFLQIFPDILLFQLLSLWIDRKSLTNLDSALCSEEKRPYFFKIFTISAHTFSWQIEDDKKYDECWIPWALKRGICLQKIVFDFSIWSNFPTLLAAGIVNLNGTEEVDFLDSFNKDSLTEINRENQLNQIMNMCPKLSRLAMIYSRALNLSSFFQRHSTTPILQQLTSLMILRVSLHCDLYGNVDNGMLTQLANKCTNLRSLALDCSHSHTSDLHLLLSNCTQMRVIVLYEVKLTDELVCAVMVRKDTLLKLVILPLPSSKTTIDVCLPLLSGLLHTAHIEIDCRNEELTCANHSIKLQRQMSDRHRWESHLELNGLHANTLYKCLQTCTILFRLVLVNTYMTPTLLYLAVTSRVLESLHKLELHKCDQHASQWILLLVKHCSTLRHLQFNECVGLQYTYKQFCMQNHSLNWLIICNCPLINFSAVVKILDEHLHMVSVECKQCQQMIIKSKFETMTMTKTTTKNSMEFVTKYSDKVHV
jgi:hypothetical protein